MTPTMTNRSLKLLLFLFFVGQCTWLLGQKKAAQIEILNANSLEYDESTGQKAKKLIGDVQLKHDNALMFCDSAYVFSETNSMHAYSNVKITQGDSLQLTGDSLIYYGNTKKAILRGNIQLLNKDVTLTTKFLDYDRTSNVAYYFNGGEMISRQQQDTLTSEKGYYHTETQSFYFKENVVLTNPQYKIFADTLRFHTPTETVYFLGKTTIISNDNFIYTQDGWYNTKNNTSTFYKDSYIYSDNKFIFGDTIYYDRNNGYGKITCNAIISDTTEKLHLLGDDVKFFEQKDSAVITQEALMMQVLDNDTLFLHADTFKIYASYKHHIDSLTSDTLKSDTLRNLLAYHDVKFFKTDMQGKADSVVYNFADSTVNFYTLPVIWSEENQLTADFIYLQMANKKIDAIYMDDNAFIISKADSIYPHYNQVKGNNMIGFFREKQLYKINVMKQAETIYFAKDDDNKYIGVNKATGNNMLIFLEDNTLKSLTFIKDPEGTFYPINNPSPKDLVLKGFNWNNTERPKDRFDIY
ncbi:MAG TPA: OstA-like protein [Vicingaceae bacterium]|nr:OstA-like protein [Vicingaceae bacterium]